MFSIASSRGEIAVSQGALSDHLTLLLEEWGRQESLAERGAAAALFERAEDMPTLMVKVGAAPLGSRSFM